MAGSYEIYSTVKHGLVREFKRHKGSAELLGAPRGYQSFGDAVIRHTMHYPTFNQGLNGETLLDEHWWELEGWRVFFPDSVELLDMLWRAKMSLLPSDLTLPTAFSVAWPRGAVVDGVELPGCLVTYGLKGERRRVARSFAKRYLGGGDALQIQDGGAEDVPRLTVAYHVGSGLERMIHRVTAPENFMEDVLTSAEKMHEALGTYGGRIGCYDLTEEELRLQYIVARMVVALVVYMNAKRDAVVEGWPSDVKRRELRHAGMQSPSPAVVATPAAFRRGHGSPIPHYRTWHFRRYPVKRDGSRTAGVVFIHETIVNAEVDPATVLVKDK